jgi:hypothetical protein
MKINNEFDVMYRNKIESIILKHGSDTVYLKFILMKKHRIE